MRSDLLERKGPILGKVARRVNPLFGCNEKEALLQLIDPIAVVAVRTVVLHTSYALHYSTNDSKFTSAPSLASSEPFWLFLVPP